jgi:hypothetical protein
MATGIISIAAFTPEMRWLARGLLAANLVAYLALWLLLIMRLEQFSFEFSPCAMKTGHNSGKSSIVVS